MDYNARMFSPRLGRFVSADTIVPGSMPVHWDRYAYTQNNPILYNDPSGHDVGCSAADRACDDQNAVSEKAQNEIEQALNADKKRKQQQREVYFNEEEGLCVTTFNIGCSGTIESYTDFLVNTNFPSLGREFEKHASSVGDVLDTIDTGSELFQYGKNFITTNKDLPFKSGIPIDGVIQLIQDYPNKKLSLLQRYGRASIVTGEAYITGFASGAVGTSVGLASAGVAAGSTGNAIVVLGAYMAGYGVGYLATNRIMSNGLSQYNHDVIFPAAGLVE